MSLLLVHADLGYELPGERGLLRAAPADEERARSIPELTL